MRIPIVSFLLLLLQTLPAAAQERTSEWNYIDERWPKHIGPLIEEKDPDAYIHVVTGRESARLTGWAGRQGSPALDTVSACGLHFDGYLRQRPRGTYLIIVISPDDKVDHRLKWIPVEYRLDEKDVEYFMRRDGGPNQESEHVRPEQRVRQQSDLPMPSGRPDIRTYPYYVESRKYLFDNGSPTRELRTRGEPVIRAKFKYLEVLKFADPRELADHEQLQVYLPWVDNCPTKPSFQFHHEERQEVVWDYPMRAWVSVGAGFMTPYHEGGWSAVHPQPSFFLRLAYLWWDHHGFTIEGFGTTLHETSAGRNEFGEMERVSYGYAWRFAKHLTLSPEFGFRGVSGSSFISPGVGGGLNLAWEFPGTRHQSTGQRLMFEAGCNFERNFGTTLGSHDLRGAFGDCKFGMGLGW